MIDPEIAAYYGVVTEEPADAAGFSFAELARPEGALVFAQAFASRLRARTLDVAGTYLASWLARLSGAYQETLVQASAELRLQPENTFLYLSGEGPAVSLSFFLKTAELRPLPAGVGRGSAARAGMDRFYGELVRPLFESVAAAAAVQPQTLWALLATSLRYGWDRLQAKELPEPYGSRLAHDFSYLMQEMPGEIFGTGSRNPLAVRFRSVDSPYEPGAKVLIRAACCLAYKTDNGYGYCYNCPKLSREEREEQFREIRRRMATP
ncbi:(2Fe-2S)-binding protein [Gorillibacterium sp. sgz500922]|uniref:(2Fe-2S)-binding protein n=1 Tax=Gorillibacterium sp. sgz500922 TaxID=3446694 RepID=UPI003F6789D4